jgi:hypothetical protein
MYNEWQGLNETRQSPTLSREWLIGMGKGAAKSNVSVQYCMTFARMVLQTAEVPAVTTFRASDDYGPGQTGYYPTAKPGKPPTDGSTGCGFPYCVYYVGTTSILAYAMQLGPSKDNYVSCNREGGLYSCLPSACLPAWSLLSQLPTGCAILNSTATSQ